LVISTTPTPREATFHGMPQRREVLAFDDLGFGADAETTDLVIRCHIHGRALGSGRQSAVSG
jgi:hypothetical protein